MYGGISNAHIQWFTDVEILADTNDHYISV